MDTNLVGSSVFQPLMFAGQYQDLETSTFLDDGATAFLPAENLGGRRTYDPFSGAYLQMDPSTFHTWSSYVYAGSNPVGNRDVVVSDAAASIVSPIIISGNGCSLVLTFSVQYATAFLTTQGGECTFTSSVSQPTGGGDTSINSNLEQSAGILSPLPDPPRPTTGNGTNLVCTQSPLFEEVSCIPGSGNADCCIMTGPWKNHVIMFNTSDGLPACTNYIQDPNLSNQTCSKPGPTINGVKHPHHYYDRMHFGDVWRCCRLDPLSGYFRSDSADNPP